jgi:hypothetical protein
MRCSLEVRITRSGSECWCRGLLGVRWSISLAATCPTRAASSRTAHDLVAALQLKATVRLVHGCQRYALGVFDEIPDVGGHCLALPDDTDLTPLRFARRDRRE